MKKHCKVYASLLGMILYWATAVSASERKVCIDNNWKFHRGCIANAEQPAFNVGTGKVGKAKR